MTKRATKTDGGRGASPAAAEEDGRIKRIITCGGQRKRSDGGGLASHVAV